MHITPKRRYRATLIPQDTPPDQAELQASQGTLPYLQFMAANSGVAARIAHAVSGLPVLAVERIEVPA